MTTTATRHQIGTTIHGEQVDVVQVRGGYRIRIDDFDWHGKATSLEIAMLAAANLVPQHRRTAEAAHLPSFGGAR
jgi:hypothetical protein